MAIDPPNPEFLNQFKTELRTRDLRLLAYDYVLSGGSRILRRENFLKLRTEVAYRWRKWGVHANDIVMVGSGKLGYSLHPDHRYTQFHAKSDFDLAILSERLFDHYWISVHRYMQNHGEWDNRFDFYDYLTGGWIRPDYLPTNNFEDRGEWWAYFGKLANRTDFGRKKIRAGVYKSWDFLEVYHLNNLQACKLELENGDV